MRCLKNVNSNFASFTAFRVLNSFSGFTRFYLKLTIKWDLFYSDCPVKNCEKEIKINNYLFIIKWKNNLWK